MPSRRLSPTAGGPEELLSCAPTTGPTLVAHLKYSNPAVYAVHHSLPTVASHVLYALSRPPAAKRKPTASPLNACATRPEASPHFPRAGRDVFTNFCQSSSPPRDGLRLRGGFLSLQGEGGGGNPVLQSYESRGLVQAIAGQGPPGDWRLMPVSRHSESGVPLKMFD